MSENQCKTCNLKAPQKALVEQWIKDGDGNKSISDALSAEGFKISKDSIRRHRENHMGEDAEIPEETLLGVVSSPDHIWLDQKKKVDVDVSDDELLTDTSQLLVKNGVDPEKFQIVGSIWTKPSAKGVTHTFQFEPKEEAVAEENTPDLPTLYMQVMSREVPETFKRSNTSGDTLVVAFSDAQIGKVDHRGGTEALLMRMAQYVEDLKAHIIDKGYTKAIFADVGDVIEGFENTAGQMRTNDRSIMDQIDLAITLEELFISTLSDHCSTVKATSIPSNHAAWRRMKDYLGTPSDDWGVFSMKQIERLYQHTNRNNVEFFYPKPYKKSLVIPIGSEYKLGVAHGDEVTNPDRIPDWWAKQVHGGMPLAGADVLLTGHFHHVRIQPSGRRDEDLDERQKWWIQAPTMDNGSSWWANKSMGDSDPGLLVFNINEKTGFDLQSVTIL